jgi:hypothetical protein
MNNGWWLGALLVVGACGGATEGKRDSGKDGLGQCAECADPEPGDPPPSDPGDPPSDPNDPPGDPPDVPPPGPGPEPTPVDGIAILEADMPPLEPSPTGGSGGSGGAGIDPATLHLVIGSSGATCSNPREIAHCAEWAVRIPIPPHLQRVGSFPLSQVYGFVSFGDEPRSKDPFDCGMGAGSFGDGFITIQEIEGPRVVFTLSDTWAFDVDANGTYSVERCVSE